jgi:hypothetical protein
MENTRLRRAVSDLTGGNGVAGGSSGSGSSFARSSRSPSIRSQKGTIGSNQPPTQQDEAKEDCAQQG